MVSLLKDSGLEVVHYSGVVPNPPTRVVEEGAAIARDNQCDVVLAFGGGSSIDTAKAIAATASLDSIDWDHLFSTYSSPFGSHEPMPANVLPVIAVPTTSGTGSQVTQAAVITVEEKSAKLTIFHPDLFPKACVVDPELMMTLPPRMTAMTGFDAFSHAFESYIGSRVSPFVDWAALEAMRLVAKNLPLAVEDGSSIEYRSNLAMADTLAGLALANGGAAAPHPLGEIVGGYHLNLPHGLTLAMVYPEFIRTQFNKTPVRFGTVAKIFGAGDGSLNDKGSRAFRPDSQVPHQDRSGG